MKMNFLHIFFMEFLFVYVYMRTKHYSAHYVHIITLHYIVRPSALHRYIF